MTNPKPIKIKPCVFCGLSHMGTDRDDEFKPEYKWSVFCFNPECYATGPRGRFERIAIKLWNQASRRKKK